MPKRATLTFSSDDASHVKSQELHVLYCKYSGQHAMTTDCDLTKVGALLTCASTDFDMRQSLAGRVSAIAVRCGTALLRLPLRIWLQTCSGGSARRRGGAQMGQR